jgi:hypothetical protein
MTERHLSFKIHHLSSKSFYENKNIKENLPFVLKKTANEWFRHQSKLTLYRKVLKLIKIEV